MSDNAESTTKTLTIESTRFGQFEVPADSVITLPSGLIGFPRQTEFVMLEHRHPFFWLHSIGDPNLAFVVVDGAQLLANFNFEPPYGDGEVDLQKEDEYATLVVVTVRTNAAETTANLKAPLFVNLRNRKGLQVIYDDPNLSTRFPLFEAAKQAADEAAQALKADQSEPEKESK